MSTFTDEQKTELIDALLGAVNRSLAGVNAPQPVIDTFATWVEANASPAMIDDMIANPNSDVTINLSFAWRFYARRKNIDAAAQTSVWGSFAAIFPMFKSILLTAIGIPAPPV